MYNQLYNLLLEGLSHAAKEYKGRVRNHGGYLGIHHSYMDKELEDFAIKDYKQIKKLRKKVPQNKKHSDVALHKAIDRSALKATRFTRKHNL